MSHTNRPLFGGAIIVNLKPQLLDVSDLRQVPDTQEVFLYPDSTASIVVEILEKVAPEAPEDAARFHFDSLAHDNSAESSTIEVGPAVFEGRAEEGGLPPAITLSGVQKVTKYNKTTVDEVRILLGLFRIPSNGVDLVVSFNVPTSSSDGGEFASIEQDFNVLVKSLRIVDYGLFA